MPEKKRTEETAAEAEAPAEAAPEPRKDDRFQTSEWAGHTRYACTRCAFDTLNPRAIEEHIDATHPR